MPALSELRASSRCTRGHYRQGSPGQERQYKSLNLLGGTDSPANQRKQRYAEQDDDGRLTSQDRESHRQIYAPREVGQGKSQARCKTVFQMQACGSRQGECRHIGGDDERVEHDRRYGRQPGLAGTTQTPCKKSSQRGHTGADNDIDEAKRGEQLVGDKTTDTHANDCFVERKRQQDQRLSQPELYRSETDRTEGWNHCEDDVH